MPISVLKYENDTDTADFLDQIYASSLLPHIIYHQLM